MQFNKNLIAKSEELVNRQGEAVPESLEELKELVHNQRIQLKAYELLQEKLEGVDSNYIALINNFSSAVGVYRNGQFVFINPAGLKMIRISDIESTRDHKILDYVHPDSLDCFLQSIDSIRAGHNKTFLKVKLLRVDETSFYANLAASYIVFEGLPAIQIVVEDISEQVLSQGRLAEEKILLRTLIDNLPDAIYAKDVNGRKLLSNKADLDNQGLSEESTVVGKTDFDIFPFEMANRFHQVDKKVIETGIPVKNLKERIVLSGKTEKWMLSSKYPLINEDKKIIGLVGISSDITQEVEQRQKLIQLTKSIEQSPTSVIITNLDGEIEYVNQKFEQTSGYHSEELLGRMLRILKPGHTTEDEFAQIWKNINSGLEWRGEHQNRKKNHEKYWESVLISPIKDDEGNVINYIIISEDITRRKTMEKELLLAKDKAEESDRLKSAFLNNMSHEIRTPLNAIVGFSELLIDPFLEVEQQNYYYDIVQNSSTQLLQIIADIINVSTIDAGQLSANIAKTNINDLFVTLYEQFSMTNKNENVKIVYVSTLNDVEATIMTDETKLNQVISNLIINALKFTSKGKVEYGVRKVNDRLHFWVEDTGIGISKEMHGKIFERFTQADSSITKKYGGTGLGLSIAKSFIELLGGAIGLDSEEGKGSRFFFEIPYVQHK